MTLESFQLEKEFIRKVFKEHGLWTGKESEQAINVRISLMMQYAAEREKPLHERIAELEAALTVAGEVVQIAELVTYAGPTNPFWEALAKYKALNPKPTQP